MKKFCIALLGMAAITAGAEESPEPAPKDSAPVLPPAETSVLKDHKAALPTITLKQLKPKETISLDEAVDMPSDI